MLLQLTAEVSFLRSELSNNELTNNLIVTQLQNELSTLQNAVADGNTLATANSLELEESKEICTKLVGLYNGK